MLTCMPHACMQVRSLIFMFANNIAQIACLLAEREGIDNIIFSGGFIRDNAYVWSKIAFGLDFWSGSRLQVMMVFTTIGCSTILARNERHACRALFMGYVHRCTHTRLQALFMDHEGFLGALGAYLLHEEPEA